MSIDKMPPPFKDECVATGQTCAYGPYGRHGEIQCQYCGSKPDEPEAEPCGD